MTARRTWIAAALLLAGCQPHPLDIGAAADVTAPKAAAPAPLDACRVDAAGLVVTTDRGIGGTGRPDGSTVKAAPGPDGQALADRGIGGTGVDGIGGTGIDGIGGTGINGHMLLALRGRGPGHGDSGTGVYGTVTGFRSLCLNGLDIGVQGLVRLNQDGTALDTAHLHLGEVAAIDTRGSGSALHAVGIGIRHEVSGPVTAVARAGQDIEVAGQRVLLAAGTHAGEGLLPGALAVGDWVAVSGLRDLAGDIHASRLDPRGPSSVQVAGRPEAHGSGWMLGRLHLRFTGAAPPQGQRVLISGHLAAGTLMVDRVDEDRIVAGGRGTRHLIIEAYAEADGGMLRLGQGIRAAIGPRFGAPPPANRPAVFDIVADAAGEMVAVSWSSGATSASPAPASQPGGD